MLIWTWHLPELPKIQEIIFNIYNPTFLQMDDDRCRNAKQTFVFQFWSFLLMILKNVKSVAAAPGRNMSLISSAEAMGQYSSTKVLPIFISANNSYSTYIDIFEACTPRAISETVKTLEYLFWAKNSEKFKSGPIRNLKGLILTFLGPPELALYLQIFQNIFENFINSILIDSWLMELLSCPKSQIQYSSVQSPLSPIQCQS